MKPNLKQWIHNKANQQTQNNRHVFHFTTMQHKSHYTDYNLKYQGPSIKKTIGFSKQEYTEWVFPLKSFTRTDTCVSWMHYTRATNALKSHGFCTFRFHKLVSWHYWTWDGVDLTREAKIIHNDFQVEATQIWSLQVLPFHSFNSRPSQSPPYKFSISSSDYLSWGFVNWNIPNWKRNDTINYII